MAWFGVASKLEGIEADAVCGAWFARCLQRGIERKVFPYVMGTIVSRVHGANKLPAALLAVSALRYSELRHLHLLDFAAGLPCRVYQPKVGTYREACLPDGVIPGLPPRELPDADPERFGYDSVRLRIQQVIPGFIQERITWRTDTTHIFRHLQATWMFLRGIEKPIISHRLGHLSDSSVDSYLHIAELEDILLPQ